MTCSRVQDTYQAATDPDATSAARDELRLHSRRCPECAGALARIDRLRRAEGEFTAPDPGPAYWQGFDARLARRIDGLDLPEIPGRAAWASRAVLGLAATVLLTAALVVVERGRQDDPPRAGRAPADLAVPRGDAGSQEEAALLSALGEASPERVDEALDNCLPIDADVLTEDLASLVRSAAFAPEKETGAQAEGDSVYDLFLALPEEERWLFLKEMRGEIVGSGRS